MNAGPFASAAADYALAGWPCILPVPAAEKFPPPAGFTGADGRDTDLAQLLAWADSHAGHSIALRMPEDVIGLDVDEYVKGAKVKRGAATVAAHAERWGPLPPTWCSTARGNGVGPGPSRIELFRVPAGRYAAQLGPDVEVIQRHHRYAVVAPSVHTGVGQPYRWYAPDLTPSDRPPRPDELAELPPAWVAGLAEGAAQAGPAAADRDSGRVMLEELMLDARPECAEITSARLGALGAISSAAVGSRHDVMTARVHQLVQLAAAGHTGVSYAIQELAQAWSNVTAGEDRGHEYGDMLLTSARKAVTAVGPIQVPRDPCLLTAGLSAGPVGIGDPGAPAVIQGPDGPEVLQIVEPPRWASIREAIGTHAFDPTADLDQTLAEAVLARTYPALRYAYDSGGWLLRTPERWELHNKLSRWAVASVAPLMPRGDPAAEKGSDQHARASRRARLMTAAGAGGVATLMESLVSGGMHPASVALAGLDADPEILWAGGRAYSLRGSLHTAAVAQVDPAEPHLHTAAVAPERRPTPLWNALLEAVWPDPELRAWAIRVLSISLTGYADRALPILLGETGRGKTSLVSLIMSVLGTYAHAANPKLLTASANEHDTIKFELKGRRLSFIDEAPSEAKAGQEQLKLITGGGELEARRMNQDPITFRPTHTLILTANDEPMLTDPAIRSRVRLIPCEGDPDQVQRARAAIGHVSGAAWKAEAPGVLAALMAEAAGWLAEPSSAMTGAAPASVRYLAEHLGAEQDPTHRWVNTDTEPSDPGTTSDDLYQSFRTYCARIGVRHDAIPSYTKWGAALTRLGYPSYDRKVSGRVTKWRKMKIRAGWLNFEPQGSDGSDSVATFSDNSLPPKPQVNPHFSVGGSEVATTSDIYTHTHARTHAHESESEVPATPQPRYLDHSDWTIFSERLGLDADRTAAIPQTGESSNQPPRSREDLQKDKTEAARAKRAATSAAKRAAAIAEAAGQAWALPACVIPDGIGGLTVAEIGIEQALELLYLPELTVDVEHTGYPIGHADYALRTVQLGCEDYAVVLDPYDERQAAVGKSALAAAGVLHAHSATADLVPLAVAGWVDYDEAWSRMHDTAIPAKLSDPKSVGNDADLKSLAESVLGPRAVSPAADEARAALFKAGKWLKETKATTERARSGWAQVDSGCDAMVRYAAADVIDDAALAKRLPQPAPGIADRERVAQLMTARVAYRGLRLDADHVSTLRMAQKAALEEASERLRLFGVENPGSDQQIGAVAADLGAQLPRTPTGRPSVAAGVLEPLSDVSGPLGDFVWARLAYQKAENRLGLFLEPYHQLVTRGDGRARPTVYTLGADTGRMSCVRPNLQQVPREGGFRACITADPGHLLISADFSGVELRVAAALSQDPNLLRMLAEGVDLHWEAAHQVFGPEATKANRYQAKRGVFGWLYGGRAPTLASHMSTTKPTAQALIDTLGGMLPGVTAWAESVKSGVQGGRTQFQTYAGRVVHMPVLAPHAGPNYCIQGTARELLIDALMQWQQTRWGKAVLLPVHDEVLAMVPEDEAAEALATLVECMATELYGVPIVAEASAPSFAWADSA